MGRVGCRRSTLFRALVLALASLDTASQLLYLPSFGPPSDRTPSRTSLDARRAAVAGGAVVCLVRSLLGDLLVTARPSADDHADDAMTLVAWPRVDVVVRQKDGHAPAVQFSPPPPPSFLSIVGREHPAAPREGLRTRGPLAFLRLLC